MLLSKYFIIWLKLEKLQIWDCRFADLKKNLLHQIMISLLKIHLLKVCPLQNVWRCLLERNYTVQSTEPKNHAKTIFETRVSRPELGSFEYFCYEILFF